VILGLVLYGIVDQLIVRPRIAVAKVGDTVIRVRDFKSTVQYSRIQTLNQAYNYYTYASYFGEYGQSFLDTALDMVTELNNPVAYGSQVLDEMIDNEIIRQEAAARGISVSEDEIDLALQAAFGFFPGGTPTPTQTATLQSTPTLSLTQLALVPQTSTPTEISEATPTLTEDIEGQSEEEAETEEVEIADETTDEEIAVENLEVEVTPTPETSPTITPSPTVYTTEIFAQDIKDFNDLYKIYNFNIEDLRRIFEVDLLREKLAAEIGADVEPFKEEVWARHILVETEEEAEEVLALLSEGKDWNELAAEFSIDESNKDQGGDLGWFDNQTMVAPFTDAAFQLEIGEISEPIETDFGFHIIQGLGKRETQLTDDELLARRNDIFNSWLSEQRNDRSDIEIYDSWEKYVPDTPQVPVDFMTQLYQSTMQ
jgi:parvulin-like peptidyl-prolyl isomerase